MGFTSDGEKELHWTNHMECCILIVILKGFYVEEVQGHNKKVGTNATSAIAE